MKTGTGSVAITGCGWVTPFAAGSISQVLSGAEAIRGPKAVRLTSEPIVGSRQSGSNPASEETCGAHQSSESWAIPNEWVDDYSNLSKELRLDKGAWIAAAALTHACQDASLEIESLVGERIGLILGCGLAGQLGMIGFAEEVRQQSPRFVSPIHFPQTVGNYIAGALARGFNIRGPNMTIASGPASGLDAIAEGCEHILSRRADVVFAGGAEPLSQTLAEGFAEPGVILSEGACFLVLEASDVAATRGVKALATVVGWGNMDERAAEFTPPGQAESATASAAKILSVAGWRYPGAILIEDWIGRCLGSLGGAAVAAAIGAAGGNSVPLLDQSDLNSTSVRPVALDGLRGPDGAIPALIIANADGTHQTTLELAI